MDIQEEADVESITMSDILNLSSWNRPRDTAELIDFIARHEAGLTAVEDES